jgi:NAD(P)-dependent dehydrogenase (short-subunit alcohol dehydrogenase family)
MRGDFEMRGKAALVTGAAGDIGRATALRLAELGCDVCLVDAAGPALEAVADAARAAGVRAQTHSADLGSAAGCKAAVDAAVAAFGRLDALCNAANAFVPARAAEMAEADFAFTFATNVAAPFFLFQAAIPHLLESGGAVVFVSSAAAVITTPNTAAYSASKAALDHLTRVLAKEYRDANVRINTVAAGGVAVALASQARTDKGVDPEAVRSATVARPLIPVERVAEAIAFLASDAAQGYHGAVVALDNGMSLG